MYTYTHIQICSIKHSMNSGLPYFGAGGVGAYGVGAYDVGASNAGANDVGVPGVGAHNFGAHSKTPSLYFSKHSKHNAITDYTVMHLHSSARLAAACTKALHTGLAYIGLYYIATSAS